MLTTTDRRYIQTTIGQSLNKGLERNRIQFRKEMQETKKEMWEFVRGLSEENRSHMTALKEGFQDQVRSLAELVADKPSREEVREIVREESRYIIRDELTKTVVPCIKKAIDSLMLPHIAEIKSMLGIQDKRIIRLEEKCF